jgi:hypothetical protein
MPARRDPETAPEQRVSPAKRRPGGTRTQWVPVTELSPLARALLSADLGGRDVVPRHVADRVIAQAEQWAEQGFTVDTVRFWTDVSPAAAGYLAQRGVDPSVLDLPVSAFPGAPPVALRLAITGGRMPVEQAYELLVLTGAHAPSWSKNNAPVSPAAPPRAAPPPVTMSDPQPPEPTPPSRGPVAPVIFSHPTPEHHRR